MTDVRIALCAELDLGVIDGAAVWLQSLALTLAKRNRVTVVSRVPIKRDLLTRPLADEPRIHLDVPRRARTLDELLDATAGHDVVIARGLELCRLAARRDDLHGRLWAYLTDVPQRPDRLDAAVRGTLARIAGATRHVLCQTEPLRAHLEAYVPGVAGKAILLPPMIPDVLPARAAVPGPVDGRPFRLGYAGKLSPHWYTAEMIEATRQLRAGGNDVELHVIGDKLFGSASWTARVERALTETEGVTWHRGKPRDEALRLMASFDLALASRAPELDDTLELSTKLLEYGALGLPILLNRAPMNAALLGDDYPLFAPKLQLGILGARDPELRRAAATRAEAASHGHRFDAIGARLQPWIAAAIAGAPAVLDVARPKLAGAEHRLGLLELDALPRALAHLRRLRADDPRYRLHVRATPGRVADLGDLRDAVGFDAPDPDLGSWLRKIGVVLTDDPELAALATASGAEATALPRSTA